MLPRNPLRGATLHISQTRQCLENAHSNFVPKGRRIASARAFASQPVFAGCFHKAIKELPQTSDCVLNPLCVRFHLCVDGESL